MPHVKVGELDLWKAHADDKGTRSAPLAAGRARAAQLARVEARSGIGGRERRERRVELAVEIKDDVLVAIDVYLWRGTGGEPRNREWTAGLMLRRTC